MAPGHSPRKIRPTVLDRELNRFSQNLEQLAEYFKLPSRNGQR